VNDVNFGKVFFAPVSMSKDGKKSVIEIFRDENQSKYNRLQFQLCPDVQLPLEAPFGLDQLRDDASGDRRGLMLKVTDSQTVEAMQLLDENLVSTAIERSKEWFKKPLERASVEARHMPIIKQKEKGGEEMNAIKIMIKTGSSAVPTKLDLLEPNGYVRKNGATIEDLVKPGALVVPIVSTYSPWFMGGGSSFGISFQAEKLLVKPCQDAEETTDFVSSVPLKVRKTCEEQMSTAVVRSPSSTASHDGTAAVKLEGENEDDDERAM